MAELNEKQQTLYEILLNFINVACDSETIRKTLINLIDDLIEDLLKEWDNLR